MTMWMSGPADAVARDAYNNGPHPSRSRVLGGMLDEGDVLVGKNQNCEIVSVLHAVNNDLVEVPPGVWPYPGTTKPLAADHA